MKKKFTLSILSAFLFFSFGQAQITKGERFLGGNFNMYWQNSKSEMDQKSKHSSIQVTPKFGFPLKNSWVAGPLLGYGHSKDYSQNTQYKSENKSQSYYVGGFIRKFHAFNDMFGIFGEFESSYGFGKGNYRSENAGSVTESETKFEALNAGLKPGLYFKPGKRFILQATLGNIGYTVYTNKPEGGTMTKNKTFSASLTNSLGFGLQYILK